MKRKLLTVIGARPQIIKAAAISRIIRNRFFDQVQEVILHTGQHYDENMSQVFFEELEIPWPDYNLQVGSGRHGEQTAKMIKGIEEILLREEVDGIILYGDTNSTLAGAIAASKLHVPVIHIEAGLRSYNMEMPEEINRILCDQVSTLLFAPTITGIENLEKEGFNRLHPHFAYGKQRKIYHSGDVMYDNSLFFAEKADQYSNVLGENDLKSNEYVLATIHRDNNTDHSERLSAIFKALLDIIEKHQIKMIIPLHPRTKKLLEKNLYDELYQSVMKTERLIFIPPVSFLDMIQLEKNALMVLTDSGGVQKEAYFFRKPCVILRPETEWIEIVNEGAGIVVDSDYDKILTGFEEMKQCRSQFKPVFGNGHASEYIMTTILEELNSSDHSMN